MNANDRRLADSKRTLRNVLAAFEKRPSAKAFMDLTGAMLAYQTAKQDVEEAALAERQNDATPERCPLYLNAYSQCVLDAGHSCACRDWGAGAKWRERELAGAGK